MDCAAGGPLEPALVAPPDPASLRLRCLSRTKQLKTGNRPCYSLQVNKLGAQNLQHAIIAKLSAGKPKAKEICSFIKSNWKIKGAFTTGSMHPRHEFIVLESHKDLVEAMAFPIHQIGLFLFRFFRWSPQINIKQESSRTVTWIHVPGLSPMFFIEGYLRRIGDEIGLFLMADARTLNMTCPAYALMLVEIDLKRPLIREIYIVSTTGEGGHNLSECRKGDAPGPGNIPGGRPSKDTTKPSAIPAPNRFVPSQRDRDRLRAKVFRECCEQDDEKLKLKQQGRPRSRRRPLSE
uniref:DUF4283 domain-containing protein n=1 Tax=Kalanchoe fedtschenkoi TaxID=63787 RepID=A0A7N0UH94_KALFE